MQALRPGSYVEVEAPPALGGDVPFTACAWLWTAIPRHGEQALLGLGDAPDAGFALLIGAGGDLELRLGQGDGGVQHVRTGVPLQERMWTFAACAVDPAAGTATLVQYATSTGRSCRGDASTVQPLLGPIAEAARDAAAGRLRLAGRHSSQRQARGSGAARRRRRARPDDGARRRRAAR